MRLGVPQEKITRKSTQVYDISQTWGPSGGPPGGPARCRNAVAARVVEGGRQSARAGARTLNTGLVRTRVPCGGPPGAPWGPTGAPCERIPLQPVLWKAGANKRAPGPEL